MTKAEKLTKIQRRSVAVARKLVHDRLLAIGALLEVVPQIRPRGKKFIILRADGKPIPRRARYFVLRLDHHHPNGDKGNWETWCAREALRHYALYCTGRRITPERWLVMLSKFSRQCREGGKAAKLALKENK